MKRTSFLLGPVLMLLSTAAYAAPDAGPDAAVHGGITDSGADSAAPVVDASAVDSGSGDGSATCGNHRLDAEEDCDGERFGGKNCATETMGAKPNGFLLCSNTCHVSTTGCTAGKGDGGGSDSGAGGAATGAGGATSSSSGTKSSSGGTKSSSGGTPSTASPDAGTSSGSRELTAVAAAASRTRLAPSTTVPEQQHFFSLDCS